MKVRVLYGDRNGQRGLMFAGLGDRVYSYHPAHKEEGEMLLQGGSTGIVMLYGDHDVDIMLDVAKKATGRIDHIQATSPRFNSMLPDSQLDELNKES